MLRKNI